MRKLCGCSGILMRKGLSDYRALSSLTFTFTCGKLDLGIINVGVGTSGNSLYVSNTISEKDLPNYISPKGIWLSGCCSIHLYADEYFPLGSTDTHY